MTDAVDTQTDNAEFVGSHLKAKNGYGQNGFQGASSDLPGQKTTSGFLPAVEVARSDWQTRKVSDKQLAPAHGQRDPNANPRKMATFVDRRK